MKTNDWMDFVTEKALRRFASRTSRRNFLAALGTVLAGGSIVPLLPVARGAGRSNDPGDPSTCEYWRYCGIDGFLCSCCGGSQSACPPGTSMSTITWIGTCKNPADGRDYIISYNDCCGKSSCGRCFCNRNEGDTPLYQPGKSNDYNWCSGNSEANIPYHCSTGRIVSVVG
jgi:methylamine dehydrogenase light chain